MTPTQARQLRTILWIVAILAVIRLWVMPLWNSFWLDETLTVWAIRDGFGRLFNAVPMMLQPVAFCVLEWLTSRVGGIHEAPLRLPSLAAAIGTLYIYYRIGVEFIDRSAGLSLAALYITLPQVAIEIPNARSYSLALLAESAAVLFLLRWLRGGCMRNGILWITCAVAAGHLHQFFFMVLPLEVGLVLWRVCTRRFVRGWQLVVCGTIGVALFAPIIPQLLAMSQQAKILSWVPRPTLLDLFKALTPIFTLPLLALLAFLEWLEGRRPRWIASQPSDAAVLGTLLLVAPTVIAFVLTKCSDIQVFNARWLLPTVPAALLLWGWLLHSIEPPFIREMALACGLVVSLVITGGVSAIPDYHHEDWRTAVRSVPESGATLVYCGLAEARRLDWLQQPERWSYLMSPILAYREIVQPADAFVVPFDFNRAGQEYLKRLITARILQQESVALVTRQYFAGPLWVVWISERLEKAGFRQTRHSAYGSVQVDLFQRPRARTALLCPPPNRD